MHRIGLRSAYCLQTKIVSQSGDGQEEPWCVSLCASSDTQSGMFLNSYVDIAIEYDSSVSHQALQQIALKSYQGFIHSKENCTQQMSAQVNVSFHLNVEKLSLHHLYNQSLKSLTTIECSVPILDFSIHFYTLPRYQESISFLVSCLSYCRLWKYKSDFFLIVFRFRFALVRSLCLACCFAVLNASASLLWSHCDYSLLAVTCFQCFLSYLTHLLGKSPKQNECMVFNK